MYRFLKLHLSGETVGQLESIGLSELAVAALFIDLFHRKVLSFQTADRNRHPTALFAVIVYARNLSGLPADRHHFKSIVLIYEIPRIERLAPENILLKRIGIDRVVAEVIVNRFAYEFLIRNLTKTLDELVYRYPVHLAQMARPGWNLKGRF